jgi:putative endopeptidase
MNKSKKNGAKNKIKQKTRKNYKIACRTIKAPTRLQSKDYKHGNKGVLGYAPINYDNYDSKYKSFEKKLSSKFTSKNIKAQLLEEFKHKRKDFISPRDDFYTYVNHVWLNQNEKQFTLKDKYYIKYDDFSITQDKVYDELLDIVDKKSTKSCIQDVCMSGLKRTSKHNHEIERHIKDTIIKVDEFIKNDDFYGLMTDINKFENISIISPILWKLLPDLKDPSIYCNYIIVPNLPIYDINVYMGKHPNNVEHLHIIDKKYNMYIHDIFKVVKKYDTTNIDYGSRLGYDFINIGKDILSAQSDNILSIESYEGYNKITASDSLEKYGFDWVKMASSLGYKNVPEFFVTDNITYLKNIMQILNANWKSLVYRNYWIYLYVRHQIRTHEIYQSIYFNFYRHFIAGVSRRYPNKIYAIMLLSLTFDKFLSTEYVNTYAIPENVEYVKNMTEDLRLVFIKILKRNKWLSPNTKRMAILKITNIKIYIGFTDHLIDDPLLNYSPIDFWGNLDKIYTWRLKKFVSLNGKHIINIPMVNWNTLSLNGRQPYIVNAFYTPSRNDLYIPTAYLQRPFLNIYDYGVDYNVAYLGTTIAHELSHALDDTGSLFDDKGKLDNWWSDHDRRVFNDKVTNVVKQYEKFASYDGIKYNARISTGENIADITAITICEEYLKDFQYKYTLNIPNKYILFTGFYIYYAIQLRQVIKNKSIDRELLVNPHALDKYRVNIPLSRLNLFKIIYNINKNDKMYWNTTDSIW